MSLADKITLLRKQQGWSQIDLAEKLDVSRQSVSKWEMGQAVPELDKIIKLSELFDVTTDYLLKDNVDHSTPPPEPETASEPGPAPASEPVIQEGGTPKKKWPAWRWVAIVIAASFLLVLVLFIIAAVSFNYLADSATYANENSTWLDVQPTPSILAQSETSWTIEAVSTDQVYEGPVLETYTFGEGETALTGDPISPEEMAAIAREYEPFGVTYDAQADQWYYDGQAIRVFTDIMTSNGQPLEGGNFRGVMRSFAGTGTIDIRTVRDYDNLNADGNGTLTGMEVFNANSDAVWEESP